MGSSAVSPFHSAPSIISKAVPYQQTRMSRLTVIHIRSNLEVTHDLATAQRLHELLEASRLWLSASLLGYLGVRGR